MVTTQAFEEPAGTLPLTKENAKCAPSLGRIETSPAPVVRFLPQSTQLSFRSAEICSVSELRRIAVYGRTGNAPTSLVEHLFLNGNESVRTTGLVLSVTGGGRVELGDPLSGESARTPAAVQPTIGSRTPLIGRGSQGKRKLHTVSVRRRSSSSLLGKRGASIADTAVAMPSPCSQRASAAVTTSRERTFPPPQRSQPDGAKPAPTSTGHGNIRLFVESPPPTPRPPPSIRVGDIVTVIGECVAPGGAPLIRARFMNVVTGLDVTLWYRAVLLRRKYLRDELRWKENSGKCGLGPPAPIG